jgi:hypothetical protein
MSSLHFSQPADGNFLTLPATTTAAVESAAPVKPTSEAGASARGKAAGFSATTDAAEGARTDAALTTRFSVSSSCPIVSAERPGGRTGMIESSATVESAAIEIVPVIKRGAPREIPAVVKKHGVVVPVESPMTPPPPITTPPPDPEADSK